MTPPPPSRIAPATVTWLHILCRNIYKMQGINLWFIFRRWANIVPALAEHFVFAGMYFIWTVLTMKFVRVDHSFNPLAAKLLILNFHPLEVVSRWRDPQLQVSENYLDLTKWRFTLFKSC